MIFKTNKIDAEIQMYIVEKVEHLKKEYSVNITFICDEIYTNVTKVVVDVLGAKIKARTEFILHKKTYQKEVDNFFELIEAYIMENELDIEICIACSKKPALPDDVLCANCKSEIEAIKIW